MDSTIDVSFIEEYNAQLHVRYENQGFLYKNLTREGTCEGTRVYWQRFGSFTAGDKNRNGQVDLAHGDFCQQVRKLDIGILVPG